jgi:ATP-binding cassette, subfamily B, multidrug efflux pump
MSQFINEDKVKAGIGIWQMLKGLWPFAKRHPWILTAAGFSILGVAVSSRLLPTIVGYAIDHGIQEKNLSVLKWAALGFLIAEIAHGLFLFLYQFLFQWFGNRLLFHVREALIIHTQRLPMTYFDKTPIGRVVTRLTNDTSTLGEVFTDGIINVVTETAVLISIVVSMAFISLKLTLATLILAPLFIFSAYRITLIIRDILRESKKRLSTLTSYAAENLNGIKVIQLFNRVDRNRKRFAGLSRDYRDSLIQSVKQYAIMQPIMNLFNAITITIALYYGGILGTDNAIPLGALVAFLMHVQDFIPPLREILEKYQQFQNSLTSAERVFHLLDEPQEKLAEENAIFGKVKGHILVRNLNFRYADNLPPVLKNINLEIQPGQNVALIGRTGSGKTTFISLMQRFYDAPEKTLFVDGLDVTRIDRQSLRRHVGVVQQDNFIFRGTVRDNVSLLDPAIDDKKIIESLEQVGYLRLLKRSNRTLDSFVEERGANLSVGERQLIAFARILAFAPDILILDEATANIDSETEKLIKKATEEVTHGRTSLIIAHRLSTIQHCDKIVVLDHGEILESGTHQELLGRGGLYATQVAEKGSNLISILS